MSNYYTNRTCRSFFLLLATVFFTAVLVTTGCQDSSISGTEADSDATEATIRVSDEKLPEGVDRSDVHITDEENLTVYDGDQSELESSLLWKEPSGMEVRPGEDGCKKVQTGFPFEFYGEAYKHVWVNANGNLTLDGCNEAWSHPDVPDQDRVLIAPLYGDFSPPTSGAVYVDTSGTAPNRTFTATWSEVPEFKGTSGPNSFQVRLFEEDGAIQFGYQELSTDGYNWAYSSPSTDPKMDVGISSGEEAFINSASGSEIPALDSTNICYVPDGNGGYEEKAGACEDVNQPPVAEAGSDQTVECSGDPTSVSLDASESSDPDGDELSYVWSLGGTELSAGESPTVDLGYGTHAITLTVTDSEGAVDTDEVTVEVADTTPPELDYSTETTRLWPPNHEMKEAVTGISASDICDAGPSVTVEVTSDEAINGEGDGNTAPDWQVVENEDGTLDVLLRAERSGPGDGRTYTVTMTAEDHAENTTEETVEVTVPHDANGGGPR